MVSLQNLTFGYKKDQRLFKNLDLELPKGNIYGLLGRNGAGKSTLLKVLTGLLFPDEGKVFVSDLQPRDRYPSFLQEIYILNEEFYVPSMKMETYIRLYSPFYPRFSHEQLEASLGEFQLDKQNNLSNLSYGQKKKFLLSFGLATDCKLLILDEPTNGLDIPSKSLFRKIVANAIHDERSFVISTHQVRDMENLIDPVIIIDGGEIIFHQNLDKISNTLTVERAPELRNPDEAIYFESSFGGYTILKENKGGQETSVNLELLFNAVTSERSRIDQIFKNR